MNDDDQRPSKKWWLLGALLGGALPIVLLLVCLALNQLDIAAGIFALALGLLEIPVAIIGRALELPIETGGIAQILYSFNALGYTCLVLFWAFVGLLVGALFGMWKPSD